MYGDVAITANGQGRQGDGGLTADRRWRGKVSITGEKAEEKEGEEKKD